MWVICMLATLQIRDYHDPIASYAFLMQAQGILLTLVLLMVVRWNESNKFKWLLLGVGLLLTSLLYSELNLIGFPMAMAFICISKQARKDKIRAGLFLGAVLLCVLLAMFYVRACATSAYNGTRFGSLSSFAGTYARQWSAALPGSFYMLRYQQFFSIDRMIQAFCSDWSAWLLFAVVAYAIYHCIEASSWTLRQCNAKELVLLACSLVFLPPFFAAVSEKLQQELAPRWGWGYLHVYYAYFGVALCAVAFLVWIAQRGGKTKMILVAILAFSVIANSIINKSVCMERNRAFSMELRTATASALKNGLLNRVRDGDLLVLEGMPFYMNSSFIYQYSGKKVVLDGNDCGVCMPRQELNANPQRFKIEQRYEPGIGWKIGLVCLPR
jgi:hypothetical protein